VKATTVFLALVPGAPCSMTKSAVGATYVVVARQQPLASAWSTDTALREHEGEVPPAHRSAVRVGISATHMWCAETSSGNAGRGRWGAKGGGDPPARIATWRRSVRVSGKQGDRAASGYLFLVRHLRHARLIMDANVVKQLAGPAIRQEHRPHEALAAGSNFGPASDELTRKARDLDGGSTDDGGRPGLLTSRMGTSPLEWRGCATCPSVASELPGSASTC